MCPQPPHAWRLTRKVKAKTISLALSAEQAQLYKKAILHHRQLEAILRKMREISEEVSKNGASLNWVGKGGRNGKCESTGHPVANGL